MDFLEWADYNHLHSQIPSANTDDSLSQRQISSLHSIGITYLLPSFI